MEQELKGLYDQLRADYAALRDAVAAKAADAATGAVDPLIEAKLARVNSAINEKEAARDEKLAELRAVVDRIATVQPAQTPESGKAASELKRFNAELRNNAAAKNRPSVDLSSEQATEYRAAFERMLRVGPGNLLDAERRAMSAGSDPDGGYTITPDMSGRIVERLFETSPMRQYATVQSIGTDKLVGFSDTGSATSGGWVSELGTRSDSNTPQIGRYEIVAHEQYAQPKASQVVIEDSMWDVQGWLVKKGSEILSRDQNTAFVSGTGVGKPKGFAAYTTAATADASRTWGEFEHVATGAATFGTDPNGIQKLIGLIHKMNPNYLRNSAFYMNRNTLSTLRQLTDASASGKFVFVPSFQAAVPDTLLGYPVRVLVDMADIASAALAVAFGDMAETYTIVDRVGLGLKIVDPYTDKPNVRFYLRARVGGAAVNFDSLKFLKFS